MTLTNTHGACVVGYRYARLGIISARMMMEQQFCKAAESFRAGRLVECRDRLLEGSVRSEAAAIDVATFSAAARLQSSAVVFGLQPLDLSLQSLSPTVSIVV